MTLPSILALSVFAVIVVLMLFAINPRGCEPDAKEFSDEGPYGDPVGYDGKEKLK